MPKSAAPLDMTAAQRDSLEVLAKSSSAEFRVVRRAQALLMAADGVANSRIAEAVGATPVTVRAWRTQFAADGLDKFAQVREGRGRKPTYDQAKIDEIVQLTQNSKPEGATHWSVRTMAAQVGVSSAMVQRVWSARGLKPHLVRSFKLSNDPRFEEKLVDVVGLYLNPPEHAIVLSVDEKSSIQALDRTQASLPMVKGRAGTMTHDYKRNGTSTLFAALDIITGTVIGQCYDRHRHDEFLKFLKLIDAQVSKDLEVHLILDNYATHKRENVQKWLKKNKRFHFHFIPTSSSWLNLVERWFRDLTDKALRRGVFHSVPDLVAAIERYVEVNNSDPKPFIWTATADSILEKVRRGRVALEKSVSQN